MILNEKYKLSNGVGIPKLGLGTWMIPEEQTDEEMAEALTHAAFYAGWPKAWAAFRMAKKIYEE